MAAQNGSISRQAADRVYEDFEPSYEWAQDDESDTLVLMIKGFRKENLRVQISSKRMLMVRGEQQISENKWRRFHKDFTIPSHSDTNNIKAKLEGDLLFISLPKVITEAKPEINNEEAKTSEASQKIPHSEKEQTSSQLKETDTTKATTSETHDGLSEEIKKKIHKKSHTLYGSKVMQKKLANLLLVIFMVVLGVYVKNAIKSSFGGSRIQDM